MTMKKVLVIFDTTFGSTKKLAEEIATGINEAGNISAIAKSQKEIKGENLAEFDAFLFGSPIHATRATRGIRGAIKKVAKADVSGKTAAAFDTYQVSSHKGRAVGQIEKEISKRLPSVILYTPGFTGLVDGYQGPLNAGEIPRAREYGRQLGSKLLE